MRLIARFLWYLPSLLWAYFVTGQIELLKRLPKTFWRYVKGDLP